MDKDEEGIMPLHWAATNDSVQTCEYLIEQGADVNTFGGSIPATPLQWAARKGYVNIIDLLTQHDANLRLIDPQDFSCLHSVTRSSNFWAVLYIICQPHIVIDERDRMGLTPLHWAARQGDEISTQILLKFGADLNAVDQDGLTALHWAALAGMRLPPRGRGKHPSEE
jgi:palmitoyltransferase ZDHHC13/17